MSSAVPVMLTDRVVASCVLQSFLQESGGCFDWALPNPSGDEDSSPLMCNSWNACNVTKLPRQVSLFAGLLSELGSQFDISHWFPHPNSVCVALFQDSKRWHFQLFSWSLPGSRWKNCWNNVQMCLCHVWRTNCSQSVFEVWHRMPDVSQKVVNHQKSKWIFNRFHSSFL